MGTLLWRSKWQPSQYRCLNSMDRGDWWATVRDVTKLATYVDIAGAISAPHIEAPRCLHWSPHYGCQGTEGAVCPGKPTAVRSGYQCLGGCSLCWKAKLSFPPWGQTFLKREQHLLGWALTQQAFSSRSVGPSIFPPASITFLHLIPYPGTFSEDSLQTENP